MQVIIEVPEVSCCRCSASAAVYPTALKRVNADGPIIDSVGNLWQPSGMLMPKGWVNAPGAPDKALCASCNEAVTAGLHKLLVQPPPAAPEPPRAAATTIPQRHQAPKVQANASVLNTNSSTKITVQPPDSKATSVQLQRPIAPTTAVTKVEPNQPTPQSVPVPKVSNIPAPPLTVGVSTPSLVQHSNERVISTTPTQAPIKQGFGLNLDAKKTSTP